MSGVLVMMLAQGASKFVATISSNQQQINLATWALAQGWDGAAAAEITISAGVYIWSDNTSIPALATGIFPDGLKLINNGYIMGRGGDGGQNNNLAGKAGGNAISLGCVVQIDTSSGYICGGGGGGGVAIAGIATPFSAGGGGGGAGGGIGGSTSQGAGGAGGGIGVSGLNGARFSGTSSGGGGGRVVTSGNTTTASNVGGYGGGAGGSGGGWCSAGSGIGGYGGGVVAGGGGTASADVSFGGGGGGGWGMPGGPAASNIVGASTGAPGAGGKAIATNGFSVTWLSGTSNVYGAVS